jgi:hypothetical protein
MGGLLSVQQGAAGDRAALGAGAALSAARLTAVGSGGGRPLGGKPLLAAPHWRDIFSAQAAD